MLVSMLPCSSKAPYLCLDSSPYCHNSVFELQMQLQVPRNITSLCGVAESKSHPRTFTDAFHQMGQATVRKGLLSSSGG